MAITLFSQRSVALFLLMLAFAYGRVCDVVVDCGAIADNSTNAAPAIEACITKCGPQATLTFPFNASFRIGSLDLSGSVGLTLQFDDLSGLYASQAQSDYPLQPALPWCDGVTCNQTQWRAVLYGRNVSGLTIRGPPSARIDGLGWPWWSNFTAGTLRYQRPKLVELVDSTDLLFEGMTYANSPFWTLHPIFSSNITFRGVTVLAPRAVGNRDGIDPDSCSDVLIDSCWVDVGDDGISLKSGWHDVTGELLPTARVRVVNTTVLSRNVAIGSACYGGIYNISVQGGRIGDDAGSSPWAVKFKTHLPYGGVVQGVSFDGVVLGAIAPNTWQQPKGGTALQVDLVQYGTGEEERMPWRRSSAFPRPAATAFTDISFLNLAVTSAVTAGSLDIQANASAAFSGLTLRNITYGSVANKKTPWACTGVAPGSTVAVDVYPPVPTSCGL